jgi:predicted enzyme related to lactoylglutathione lyase
MAKERSPSVTVNVSVDVPSLEAGLDFYSKVFGFAETARPFPQMAILDGNNVTICMHEKASGTESSVPGSPKRIYDRHWTPVHLDFHVHDFDGCLEKLKAARGKIEAEYRTQGPRPAAFCSDPFGNGFCVIGA